MVQSPEDLREDLYRVVHHYAELAQLAKKGAVDPLAQIGRIVNRRFPYLLVVIRDLLPSLERNLLTYQEVLFNLIRAGQRFSNQVGLASSLQEIEKMESQARIFVYAAKWISAENYRRPSLRETEKIRKTLADLNRKYRERFAPDLEGTATLIPYFIPRTDSQSEEVSLDRVADLVRRATVELHRLMLEYQPRKKWYFFAEDNRADMEADVWQLAWFLFRCGFGVDRIASGYYKGPLADFLHEKALDYLIAGEKSVRTVQGISNHLALISLMDFGTFFELPADYLDLDEPKEIFRHAKVMKAKRRRGAALLEKLAKLHQLYAEEPQGKLAQRFLEYRYYAAFGDYHGAHRPPDPARERAIAMYKPLLDRSTLEKRAAEDLNESGRFFSSKTREEMSGLIKLILDSLENPDRVQGAKVKILGDISSGAMGKVSIGIFRGRIVALKKVNLELTHALGDPIALLNYEAAMQARVQTPDQHPYVCSYYGLVEQGNEKLLITGYYPNDSLTQLVERNWAEKYRPPLATLSKVNLATVEVVMTQLLDCLELFRTKGVIHRDLKTDNVLYMVDESDVLNRIKVIDFGVAVSVGPGAIPDLFKGKVVGTFSYMAPEQVRGNSSFESDLYSVGAIIAVVLTGKLPMVFPKAETRQDLTKQILRVEREPRPKLAKLNPWLTKTPALKQVAALVDRMLDLDQRARPTPADVKGELQRAFKQIGDEKYSTGIFYTSG
jgi:hypothetical protein